MTEKKERQKKCYGNQIRENDIKTKKNWVMMLNRKTKGKREKSKKKN